MKLLRLFGASLLLVISASAQDGQDRNKDRVDSAVIVARSKIENASAELYPGKTIPLFTPREDGIFRISSYLEASPAITGTVCALIGWTDSFQPQIYGLSCLGSSENPYISGSVIVHAKAGTPITFTPYLATNDPPGSAIFNSFVTVEKLH